MFDRLSALVADLLRRVKALERREIPNQGGYLRTDTLLVDAGFTEVAALKRFNTIGAAEAACTGGETIKIAPGIYEEGITLTVDNLTLQGSGQPIYDVATGRLVGGTIIRGHIRQNSTIGGSILDLGVDSVDEADTEDCISDNAGENDTHRLFHNLTLVGTGTTSIAHGLYVWGHHSVVDNVKVYNCYHAIAVHGSWCNLSNIYIKSCYNSTIIIKGKSGINANDVNVNNVLIEGESTTSLRCGALTLTTANSCEVRRVNISNVVFRYAINGAFNATRPDGTGTISDIQINNFLSDNCYDPLTRGDFYFKTGSDIFLTNCRSINRSASSPPFGNDATGNAGDIYLNNCSWDSSGAPSLDGVFKAAGANGRVPGSLVALQVTLADDEAIGLTLGDNSGVVILSQPNTSARGGIIDFRAAGSPFCVIRTGGADLLATTGVLNDGDGTDVKVTVSAHTDGKFYISNRVGSTATWRLTFMGS